MRYITPSEREVRLHSRDNPYGYRYNVNHPAVRPLYERYKRKKEIPQDDALSDEERFDFEKYMYQLEQHGYFEETGAGKGRRRAKK